MTTPETEPTLGLNDTDTEELSGTDKLRLIAYLCDGESLDYLVANVRPGLVNYSEIELWALAGMFVAQMPEAASFIAFYAGAVLGVDSPKGDPSRQPPIGYRKSHLPNPDPAIIWDDWVASQQLLKRWVSAFEAGWEPDLSYLDEALLRFKNEQTH